MTFLKIRQRIAEQMGLSSIDSTADDNATLVTKFKEWVNARYRLLAAKRKWTWLLADSIIQTVADVTTGTVSATQDSVNISFSSAPSLSALGWFIQFSDSDDWYEIASHTAGTTPATLTNAYLGTTSSTLTYTLRKVYYVLPSDINSILNIKQTRNDVSLKYLSPRQLDLIVPERTATSDPKFYSIFGYNSGRQYRIEFYPSPSERMNLNLRYFKVLSELSADDDTPAFPEAFHEFLVWDVLGTYGLSFMDDTRIGIAKAEANRIYADMIKNDVDTENIAVRLAFDRSLPSTSNPLSSLDLPIQ